MGADWILQLRMCRRHDKREEEIIKGGGEREPMRARAALSRGADARFTSYT